MGGATTDSGGDHNAVDRSPRSRATPELAPDQPGPVSTELDTGEQAVPIARAPSWAASDFWGEDAAHLHDALEAPAPAPAPASAPAPAPAPPRQEDARPADPRPASRRRLPRALAATAIAAVAITAAVNGLGSAPAPPRRAALTASLHANPSAPSTAPDAAATTAAQLHNKSGAAIQHRSTHRAHARARSHSNDARRRARRVHRRRTVPDAAVVVRYLTPAPSSAPAPTTYGPAAPAPAARASSPSPAGPTGPVSLIGSGTSPSG